MGKNQDVPITSSKYFLEAVWLFLRRHKHLLPANREPTADQRQKPRPAWQTRAITGLLRAIWARIAYRSLGSSVPPRLGNSSNSGVDCFRLRKSACSGLTSAVVGSCWLLPWAQEGLVNPHEYSWKLQGLFGLMSAPPFLEGMLCHSEEIATQRVCSWHG